MFSSKNNCLMATFSGLFESPGELVSNFSDVDTQQASNILSAQHPIPPSLFFSVISPKDLDQINQAKHHCWESTAKVQWPICWIPTCSGRTSTWKKTHVNNLKILQTSIYKFDFPWLVYKSRTNGFSWWLGARWFGIVEGTPNNPFHKPPGPKPTKSVTRSASPNSPLPKRSMNWRSPYSTCVRFILFRKWEFSQHHCSFFVYIGYIIL